jgi:hypothetical protein
VHSLSLGHVNGLTLLTIAHLLGRPGLKPWLHPVHLDRRAQSLRHRERRLYSPTQDSGTDCGVLRSSAPMEFSLSKTLQYAQAREDSQMHSLPYQAESRALGRCRQYRLVGACG